jgi:small subunit ribosomal protein S16
VERPQICGRRGPQPWGGGFRAVLTKSRRSPVNQGFSSKSEEVKSSVATMIRLKRMGAKRDPFYRIVVADARTPRDGKSIEELGYYDPSVDPAEVKIDEEKALKWLSVGAKPTNTARSLLKKQGILAKFAASKNG